MVTAFELEFSVSRIWWFGFNSFDHLWHLNLDDHVVTAMDSICLGQYQLYTPWTCALRGTEAGDTEAIWVYALLCLQMKKIKSWAINLGSHKCTCAQFMWTRSIRLANAEIASYPMISTWYWGNFDPSLKHSPNDDSVVNMLNLLCFNQALPETLLGHTPMGFNPGYQHFVLWSWSSGTLLHIC